MAQLSDNVAMIRRRLGNPLPSTPSDATILELLIDQLMNQHAELANTRNHWDINDTSIVTVSGTEDYLVPATDFGRPFLVYTSDQTNAYHVRREIPIRLMQDADQMYQGPQQTFSAAEWSAAEIVFYRKADNWYARPVPIPGGTGTYVIYYEVNTYTAQGLGDTGGGLAAFHNLVRVQAALSALPQCEWVGCTISLYPQAWQIRASAIRDALLHDEGKFKQAFDLYKANSSREQVNDRMGYGWEYEDDWAGAYGAGRMTNGYGI